MVWFLHEAFQILRIFVEKLTRHPQQRVQLVFNWHVYLV